MPENFDNELFRAIDNLVRVRGNKSDTDPDSDPEAEIDAEADVPDVVAEPGMIFLQPQMEICVDIQVLHCQISYQLPVWFLHFWFLLRQ